MINRDSTILQVTVAICVLSIALGAWTYYDRYWTRNYSLDAAITQRDVDDIARFVRNDRTLLVREMSDGETLAEHVSYNCPEALPMLVELGLNSDRLGNYEMSYVGGLTPLAHYAIFARDYRLLNTIIKQGGRVDTTDEAGLTPLHYAAVRGDSQAIEILIKAGAHIDVRTRDDAERLLQLTDGEDMTPFHMATYWGELEAMQTLLNYGADADATFLYYDDPITIEQYLRMEEPLVFEAQMKVLEMLKAHRAKHAD